MSTKPTVSPLAHECVCTDGRKGGMRWGRERCGKGGSRKREEEWEGRGVAWEVRRGERDRGGEVGGGGEWRGGREGGRRRDEGGEEGGEGREGEGRGEGGGRRPKVWGGKNPTEMRKSGG